MSIQFFIENFMKILYNYTVVKLMENANLAFSKETLQHLAELSELT